MHDARRHNKITGTLPVILLFWYSAFVVTAVFLIAFFPFIFLFIQSEILTLGLYFTG